MINCFIWVRYTGVFSFYLVLKKTCRRFLPFKSYCSVWLYLHVCRSPSSLGMEQVFLKFSHYVFCCHPEANSRYHINCTNYHLSVLVCTNTAFHCSMKCRSLDHHFSLLKVIAISEVAHDNFQCHTKQVNYILFLIITRFCYIFGSKPLLITIFMTEV